MNDVEKLEQRFVELKKELSFKATLEELDEVFFLRDMAEADGVMPRLDRQLCRRLVDTFFSWNNFLHRLVMPNPHSMFESSEAGFFNEDDHEKMFAVMNRALAHCTRNNVLGVSADQAGQGAFIDDSLALWKELKPYYEDVTRRVNDNWQQKV